MTNPSPRPRVLLESDAGAMDQLIRRGEQAATVAEQKALELSQAGQSLEQLKATVPATAKSAAELATAQAKVTLDAATLAANQAAVTAQTATATLPKFRSTDQNNPPAPTQGELDANPNGIGGSRLTADGATQLLKWTPHTTAGAWVASGAPLPTTAQVADAKKTATDAAELADTAKSVADTAQSAASALLASLTLTRPQLLSGTADPGAVSRIWDEHGSLRVRNARAGETPDNGITFALAGGRMAEREWDGKNVYTAWYGLKPGDDVAGYVPALAAVPEGGVLHWTPGKYVHGMAGYAGKGNEYNPLWVIKKHWFTMKMAGVVVEAAPDLPNTTYYGGWLFLGCTHFRIEGWPVYDGRLDIREPQKFPAYDFGTGQPIYNPDGSPKMVYMDPSYANLILSGWQVTVGCKDAHMQVVGKRTLMDGVICNGGSEATDKILKGLPPIDVYLDRCTATGAARQGLSVVGVDGLTIDGGLYELTGVTTGPDGLRRGMAPTAGIDLEGEVHLHNNRVKVINSPEIRQNAGAGMMVHQYSYGVEVQSAHIHHNEDGGLFTVATSADTRIGAVRLEMNGGVDGKSNIELGISGPGTIVDGARILTGAVFAIEGNGGTGQQLRNVEVKTVATDASKAMGGIVLSTPDVVVDGLVTENIVPLGGGYDALHFENLSTGVVRNTRIRGTLPDLATKNAVSVGATADAGQISAEVTGYASGVPLPKFSLVMVSNRQLSGYSVDLDPVKIMETVSVEPGGWTLRLRSTPVFEAGRADPMLTLSVGNTKYKVAILSAAAGAADGSARYGLDVEARNLYLRGIPETFTSVTVNLTVRLMRASS